MPEFISHQAHHTWQIGDVTLRLPPMFITSGDPIQIGVSCNIAASMRIGDEVKISGYPKTLYLTAIETVDDRLCPLKLTIEQPPK